MRTRSGSIGAVPALALLLCGCASVNLPGQDGRQLVPDRPGSYAVPPSARDSGDLLRLSGGREWELAPWRQRYNLPSDVEFLVRTAAPDGAQTPVRPTIRLERVAWIRSEITGQGVRPPQVGRRWSVTGLDSLEIPLQVQPISGHPDVLRLSPKSPLPQGLYSLQLTGAATDLRARLGVGWSGLDQRDYCAATCVDRYVGSERVSYRPCAQQRRALSSSRF